MDDAAQIDASYLPAHRTASTLRERLAAMQEEARREGESPAPLPTSAIIERLIEAGFWASLLREEGRSPKISLAAHPYEESDDTLVFDRSLPVKPGALTRLAPAVERPGIHLCAWGDADDLRVWGARRALPPFTLVVEVVDPGLVVAKYSRTAAYGKFGNLAVFRGDRIKLVDEDAARRPDCPKLLATLTGLDESSPTLDNADVLVQLALSMRAHGHGGTLLLVPEPGAWQRSILLPIAYRVTPAFTKLGDLLRSERTSGEGAIRAERLREAVTGLAGLTAVDGATVMSTRFDLLAFGAKIERADGAANVRDVVVLEPVVGHVPTRVNAAELGGTRHLSAAQFVHDQRDALALVASQDGRFTIFAWSHLEDRLHAHRIETLLL